MSSNAYSFLGSPLTPLHTQGIVFLDIFPLLRDPVAGYSSPI